MSIYAADVAAAEADVTAAIASASTTTATIATLQSQLANLLALMKGWTPDTTTVTPPPTGTNSTGGLTQSPKGPSGQQFNTRYFSEYWNNGFGQWDLNAGDAKNGAWEDNGRLVAPMSAVGNQGGYDAEYDNSGQLVIVSNVTYGKVLQITAQTSTSESPYNWVSGALRTAKLVVPNQHCFIQGNIWVPANAGAWFGFWMLDQNGGNEVDILESGYASGSTPSNTVDAVNVHESGDSQIWGTTPTNMAGSWHTYAGEFNPGQFWTMTYDSTTMGHFTNGITTASTFELMLNLQVAQGASGWHPSANNTSPMIAYVAGVEVWTL